VSRTAGGHLQFRRAGPLQRNGPVGCWTGALNHKTFGRAWQFSTHGAGPRPEEKKQFSIEQLLAAVTSNGADPRSLPGRQRGPRHERPFSIRGLNLYYGDQSPAVKAHSRCRIYAQMWNGPSLRAVRAAASHVCASLTDVRPLSEPGPAPKVTSTLDGEDILSPKQDSQSAAPRIGMVFQKPDLRSRM